MLCREEPLLRSLRDRFQCSPIKVPSGRFRPLQLMRYGRPARIFADAAAALRLQDLAVHESAMPTVAGAWTRGVDANIGAKYVAGITSQRGVSAALLSQLATHQYYYFSLGQPIELSVDELELGERLKHVRVQDEQMSRMAKKGDLLIITSTIVARTLSVMVGDQSDLSATVNADLETQPSAAASGMRTTVTALAVESETPLAFAFSARRLRLSPPARLEIDYGKDIKTYGVAPSRAPTPLRGEPVYFGAPEELVDIAEGTGDGSETEFSES